MEVTNNVVSVVIDDIETSIGENKTSESTKSEACKETHHDDHLDSNDVSSQQGGDPSEDLDSSRNSDNHRSRCEVETRVLSDASNVHVVSSDEEANDTDAEDSEYHTEMSSY